MLDIHYTHNILGNKEVTGVHTDKGFIRTKCVVNCGGKHLFFSVCPLQNVRAEEMFWKRSVFIAASRLLMMNLLYMNEVNEYSRAPDRLILSQEFS